MAGAGRCSEARQRTDRFHLSSHRSRWYCYWGPVRMDRGLPWGRGPGTTEIRPDHGGRWLLDGLSDLFHRRFACRPQVDRPEADLAKLVSDVGTPAYGRDRHLSLGPVHVHELSDRVDRNSAGRHLQPAQAQSPGGPERVVTPEIPVTGIQIWNVRDPVAIRRRPAIRGGAASHSKETSTAQCVC